MGEIEGKDLEGVLETVKSMFEQNNWLVHGNVYQAQGDIHITNVQHGESNGGQTLLEKWGKWVALMTGLLTILVLTLDLPGKMRRVFSVQPTDNTCRLAIKLLSSALASLHTGYLRIAGNEATTQDPIPVGGVIPVELDKELYSTWKPAIFWANGDRSSFEELSGCPDSYTVKSSDGLVEISVDAR